MDEQEINIAKDTAAPRVECFWKAPWDIYVDFLGIAHWTLAGMLCVLWFQGGQNLCHDTFALFFKDRKILRSVLYIWGQGGGVKTILNVGLIFSQK